MKKRIVTQTITPEVQLKNLIGNEKLDRFPLSISFDFTAGVSDTATKHVRPIVTLSVEHLVSNVREPGIATLLRLNAGNIMCMLEDGLDLVCTPDIEDPILGVPVSLPYVSPANYFDVIVAYSGKVPNGYKPKEPFKVVLTLVGVAVIS